MRGEGCFSGDTEGFDECPFRIWLAVSGQGQSSNRAGHRSSDQSWQAIVFLVSVALSRTSDGLDRTKHVPKS